VDSPSDVVVLDAPGSLGTRGTTLPPLDLTASSSPVPRRRESSAADLKARGNREFASNTFLDAAATYTLALTTLTYYHEPNGDGGDNKGQTMLAAVLLLNRAGAWLKAGRYRRALEDAGAALDTGRTGAAATTFSPRQKQKAGFRRASAFYGLSAYQRALDVLDSLRAASSTVVEDDGDEEIVALAERARARLREERTGTYDWRDVYGQCRRRGGHLVDVDVAEYVGPVEARRVGLSRGRGLVATRDVDPGELLLVSKPVALASAAGHDAGSPGAVVGLNLASGQLDGPAQVELTRVLAREAHCAPELSRAVQSLYAGKGDDGGDDGVELTASRPSSPPVERVDIDAARIERVCTFNSFNPRSIAHALEEEDHEEVTTTQAEPASAPAALYLLPSMMNSHCLSNATYVFFGTVFVLRARVAIARGEEVMSSYVSPLEPLPVRQRHLDKYFSRCECALCESDRLDGVRNVGERMELSRRLAALVEEEEEGGRSVDIEEVEALIERLRGTYRDTTDDEDEDEDDRPRRVRAELYPAYRFLARKKSSSSKKPDWDSAMQQEMWALESLGARLDATLSLRWRSAASDAATPPVVPVGDVFRHPPLVGEQNAILSCLHLAQLAKENGHDDALSRCVCHVLFCLRMMLTMLVCGTERGSKVRERWMRGLLALVCLRRDMRTGSRRGDGEG
jgi:hypothetical protein